MLRKTVTRINYSWFLNITHRRLTRNHLNIDTLVTQVKEITVDEKFKVLYYSSKGFLKECTQLSKDLNSTNWSYTYRINAERIIHFQQYISRSQRCISKIESNIVYNSITSQPHSAPYPQPSIWQIVSVFKLLWRKITNKVCWFLFHNQYRFKRNYFTVSGVLILKCNNFRGVKTSSRIF